MLHDRIGRYRIVSWLGGGQFADVYLVEDPITEQQYALKLSRRRQRETASLIQEAKVLASLSHKNIVRFYTIDFYEERLFIVLEYVSGKSLRRILEEAGPMSQDFAIQLIIQVLDALEYAHSQGVLHRDLKPENILIAENGTVKITDFGLSVLMSGNFLEASVAGTPLYMAPEVWDGKYYKSSDLWAVSAILYELLAGKAPFYGDTLERVRTKIHRSKPPKIPGIRPELMRVIKRGLARSPTSRFQRALEFKESLLGAATSAGIELKGVQITSTSHRQESFLLSEEQRNAVEHGDGITLVVGGPGTGKTTTLIARVIYLIKEKGINPENIFVVTFTGRGVMDMRERLLRFLSKDIVDELWLGTYHSLAMRVVSFAGDRIGIPEDYLIANEKKQFELLRKSTGFVSEVKLSSIKREIERLKSNLVKPEDAEKTAQTDWQKLVATCYRKYQKRLLEEGFLDFSDLLFYANLILKEHMDVKHEIAFRFEHVLADEFQDIDLSQYEFIKAVSSFHYNLFVTGDDDQSIYGFRGGSHQFMKQLFIDFPQTTMFYLTQNFRTPSDIIEMAQRLISKNSNRIRKPLFASNQSKDSVVFYIGESERDEASFVAQKIIEHHSEGYSFEDMAIFYRIHSRAAPIEQALRLFKIPYNITGTSAFLTRPEIKIARTLLNMTAGFPVDTASIRMVLRNLLNVSDKDISRVTRTWKNRQKFTFPRNLDENNTNKLREFQKKIDEIKENISIYSPVQILEELLIGPGEGEEENLSQRFYEQVVFQEFLAMASEFDRGQTRDFLNYLNILESFNAPQPGAGGVRLMSVHTAKGTEFPIVFIVGLEKNTFPIRGSLVRKKDLEEERRLFYVAMTRAQEKLYLTYSRRRFGVPQDASQFLNELLISRHS